MCTHFKELLKNDIGDSWYSVVGDESSDITVLKQLGFCILYYLKNKESPAVYHI